MLIAILSDANALVIIGSVISFLMTCLIGLVVYIWNDRKKQYELDRQSNEKIFTQLFTDAEKKDDKINTLEKNHAATIVTMQTMEKSDNVLFKLNTKIEERLRTVEKQLAGL